MKLRLAVAVAPVRDRPEMALGLHEEEVSDVSLATFFVFDREMTDTLRGDVQLAGYYRGCRGCWGWRGCRGCRCWGCRGCHGCRCGCGGCGGCRC